MVLHFIMGPAFQPVNGSRDAAGSSAHRAPETRCSARPGRTVVASVTVNDRSYPASKMSARSVELEGFHRLWLRVVDRPDDVQRRDAKQLARPF